MTISAQRIFFWTLSGVGLLLLLHTVLQILYFSAGGSWQSELINRFNVDQEISVPTWFSQTVLFASALIAATIAYVMRHEKRQKWYWAGIAGIIAFISIDEGASLHETFGVQIGQLFGEGISLGFVTLRDWVIVAMIAVIAAAIIYLPFIVRLPRRTQVLFASSALCFIGGALFWESLHFTTFQFVHGEQTLAVSISNAIEEGLELVGGAVLLYALLDYLQLKSANISLTFQR